MIILFMIVSLQVHGQGKSEVEQRINVDEVPARAVEWMKDAYEGARKIKWYYEETSGLKSYEAKLKWKDYLHSVEFDTSGNIQDIEITIDWKELPCQVQQNIMHSLDSTFNKYSIQKIQRQWTGKSDDLEDAIDENETEEIDTYYEIEYYGKNDAHDELWEGLFNANGTLLHQRIIKLKPNDNLNF